MGSEGHAIVLFLSDEGQRRAPRGLLVSPFIVPSGLVEVCTKLFKEVCKGAEGGIDLPERLAAHCLTTALQSG